MPQVVKSKRVAEAKDQPKPSLEVIGGAKPTGELPFVVGDGIFGLPNQTDGIFSENAEPFYPSGIFFNPYAMTNIGLEEGNDDWVLERRPGQPLYPGSTGRGIVLVGPSMGQDEGQSRTNLVKAALLVAAGGFGAWFFWKYILEGKRW